MKISYKPRLSGLCSIYGAKHRENLRKEEDMPAAERIIQDIKERTKEEEKEEKD